MATDSTEERIVPWSLTVTNDDPDLVLPQLAEELDHLTSISRGTDFARQARSLLSAARLLFGHGDLTVTVTADGVIVDGSADEPTPVEPPPAESIRVEEFTLPEPSLPPNPEPVGATIIVEEPAGPEVAEEAPVL